jgi:hypothetical protein
MRNGRLLSVALAASLFWAAVPSSASQQPGVRGGGFIRDAVDRSKTTLTISGHDNLVLGEAGQAQYVRHTPGSKANPVHIHLDCVAVDVTSPVASAVGIGSDGSPYLAVVWDNGQGKKAPLKDAFVAVQTSMPEYVENMVDCIAGLVPLDVQGGVIKGGNFQVSSI